MKLVLDTNILMAALIKKSTTREILIHPEMEYVVPDYCFKGIEKYKEEILRKSEMSEEQLELLLEQLKTKLTIIPTDEIMRKEEAMKIMDHIDPQDAIFIAIALTIPNQGIWSQDKHFDQQNKIKVWKTKDLIKYLGIEHN